MDIEALYFEALLAQAAYADGLEADMTGERLAEKLMAVKGMTTAQAEYFASIYKVVAQQNTTDSGFSATVFQRISDDSLHFAMRGTDNDGPDWVEANAQNGQHGISYMQVADMINFYIILINAGEVPQFQFKEVSESQLLPEQIGYLIDVSLEGQKKYLIFEQFGSERGLGNGTLNNSSKFAVTGHSLGGHLASAFSLLLSSVENYTVTFNSAGFVGNFFNEFAAVIASGINANGITNMLPVEFLETVLDIKAPEDPISLLGNHISGSPIVVEIEVVGVGDGPIDYVVENHSMDRLVDSLAVANAMNTLDETLDIAKYNQFFKVSANPPVSGLLSPQLI